ncbi:MAG: hypothetical protein PHU85_09745, partial [Phycisphaerae bacterium]|nr:hypothetical protein [Phycisphaerae bacterium]
YSTKFLENEEIMLDLLRGNIGSRNVVDHTSGYPGNLTLPVFLPWGSAFAYWRSGDEICFRPSRQLFDKYFAKDTKNPSRPAVLDYSRWAPSPPDKLVPARFESIGWMGKAATSKPDNGKQE